MRRYAIAAGLALVMVTTQEAGAAEAISWLTGNELATGCRDAGAIGFAYCSGYVLAVADAMTRPSWLYPSKACFSKDVQRGQLTAVVKKYLADHPEQLHYAAFETVAYALASAFPCESR